MMMERALKIFLTGGVAVLCALIVAGNVHDPGTNLLFVQHVFSMDTILPASAMANHALAIPALWRIGFWLIVLGEGLTAILFALGTVELLRARKFRARDFHHAKRFVFAGAGCGFVTVAAQQFLDAGLVVVRDEDQDAHAEAAIRGRMMVKSV